MYNEPFCPIKVVGVVECSGVLEIVKSVNELVKEVFVRSLWGTNSNKKQAVASFRLCSYILAHMTD